MEYCKKMLECGMGKKGRKGNCIVLSPGLWFAEIFVTAYIVTYGMEKVRQLFSMEPSTLGQKWRVWVADSKWHPLDLAGIFFFLLGFLLRLLIQWYMVSHSDQPGSSLLELLDPDPDPGVKIAHKF